MANVRTRLDQSKESDKLGSLNPCYFAIKLEHTRT